MRVIKRLYLFVLKSFLPLFAMTFFIVLFIVLMQFLWKYIDDLVGKGLSMDVLGELFFYAAVSMVPMALPLAILLASLMTFGNFGEKFELTAMKASGISLLQIMKPLTVLIVAVAIGAFFFQNDLLPKAQVKMWTLLFSMRQKSPELEIPEGVFYDQIPGYNLYVSDKDRSTGMLHDVMIYANTAGSSNVTILLADSARLATTPGMKYLYLHLYKGEQFENLREQTLNDRNVPYRRESFVDKQVLIPFDANFNRLDEGGMRKQYVGKNIEELNHSIDSIGQRVDSMGKEYASGLRRDAMPLLGLSYDTPSAISAQRAAETGRRGNNSSRTTDVAVPASRQNRDRKIEAAPVVLDSIIMRLNPARRNDVFVQAKSISERRRGELEFRAAEMHDEQRSIRRHEIELLKKFTLSVACVIFFFIGAPLGAIIRKGGLGTPLVISVLLFLVYYIIDNTGYKMARDGRWPVWFGMWLSTFILAPLSVYVTNRAMNDSAVFDKDRYVMFIRKIFGIRSTRIIPYKEVIINEMQPSVAISRLLALRQEIMDSITGINAAFPARMGFVRYWTQGFDTNRLRDIALQLNADISYMSDTHNLRLIDALAMYPDIIVRWIYAPVRKPWLSKLCIAFAPLSYPFYLLSKRYRDRLRADLKNCMEISDKILLLLDPEYVPACNPVQPDFSDSESSSDQPN